MARLERRCRKCKIPLTRIKALPNRISDWMAQFVSCVVRICWLTCEEKRAIVGIRVEYQKRRYGGRRGMGGKRLMTGTEQPHQCTKSSRLYYKTSRDILGGRLQVSDKVLPGSSSTPLASDESFKSVVNEDMTSPDMVLRGLN